MRSCSSEQVAELITALAELHEQATKERSHYYVGRVVREAITVVTQLEIEVIALRRELGL